MDFLTEQELIACFDHDTLYSIYSVTVRRIGEHNFFFAIELGILVQITDKEYVMAISPI